jgi:hypothetical protein
MSDKETSSEIATIAGRVLHLQPNHTHPTEYTDLLTMAKSLAGSALSQREIVQAQIDGEDIFVLGEQHEIKSRGKIGGYEIHATVEGCLYIRPLPTVEQSNFDLYIDGYTLKGTNKVGEVLLRGPDGATVKLKSSTMTQFFERRLTPSNFGPEGEPT